MVYGRLCAISVKLDTVLDMTNLAMHVPVALAQPEHDIKP